MLRAVPFVLLVALLSACVEPGESPPVPGVEPSSVVEEATEVSAEPEPTATPALNIAWQIDSYGFDLEGNDACDIPPRDEEPADGDRWAWDVRAEASSQDAEEIRSHRIGLLGLMEDGTTLEPCSRTYPDIPAGGEAVPFSMTFAIPYRGEGTTPLVDRVTLRIDGHDAGTADLRDARDQPE